MLNRKKDALLQLNCPQDPGVYQQWLTAWHPSLEFALGSRRPQRCPCENIMKALLHFN